MWKISFITIMLATLLTIQLCNGECNVCNESNGAACTSNITFQLCFSGLPQGPIYSCPNAGDVCTGLGMICADPTGNSNIQANCGDTEQCGNCNGISDGGYACTSRTTFAMCQNDTTSIITGTCPGNEVCLTSRANSGVNPCASQCLSNIRDMCNIGSPDATTVTPSTGSPSTGTPSTGTPSTPITASPTSETPASVTTETPVMTESPTTESSSSSNTGTTLSMEDTVCASQTLIGRYPNPNDATCRTYVYCNLDRTTRKLVGRSMTCTGERFFNPSINNCQDTLPTGCTQ